MKLAADTVAAVFSDAAVVIFACVLVDGFAYSF